MLDEFFLQALAALGFTSIWAFFIFVLALAASFLSLFVAFFNRTRKYPEDPLSSGVLFFVSSTLIFLLARHVSLVLQFDVLPFEISLVFLFCSAVLVCSVAALGSLTLAAILAALTALNAVLRFSNEEGPFFISLEEWFLEYFPYDVEPKVFATGGMAFLFVTMSSLYFIRLANRRRKYRLLVDQGAGIDPAAIEKLSFILAFLIGLLVAMFATGVSIPTITLVTGVLAAGVGFAAKDILANIAAGVLLVWDGSIKLNHVISIDGGGYGWVEKMTIRHAVIMDRNDVSVLIPYSKLINSTIQNWTHNDDKVRLKIDIGVDYKTGDLGVVREAMLRSVSGDERVLEIPAPKALVISAGPSAIQMQLRFWIGDPKNGIRNVMSNVLERMLVEFGHSGISIPFDQLDVNVRSFVKDD